MRRILLIFIGSLLFVVLGAVVGLLYFQDWLGRPLSLPPEGQVLEVKPGSPLSAVADDLAEQGVLDWPAAFAAWARFTGDAGRIRAGEYRLEPGLTPAGLLEQLVAGRVILHSVTLVEGWTVREIMAALEAHPAVERTLEEGTDSAALASALELGHESAEGWFFPDTYSFPRGTTDRDILLRAWRTMERELAQAWDRRDPELPLESPYELLVLASVVERETGLPEERPAVAGVFARRLKMGMRLQTDPTVIYGLGDSYDGRLLRRHLVTDTPWNTYTRDGLPPTPIAAPGRDSLQAAARPAEGTALFFVATGLPDGSHRFSDTLEEHNRAVSQYLRRLRGNSTP